MDGRQWALRIQQLEDLVVLALFNRQLLVQLANWERLALRPLWWVLVLDIGVVVKMG